jgi:hypothetical protein
MQVHVVIKPSQFAKYFQVSARSNVGVEKRVRV